MVTWQDEAAMKYRGLIMFIQPSKARPPPKCRSAIDSTLELTTAIWNKIIYFSLCFLTVIYFTHTYGHIIYFPVCCTNISKKNKKTKKLQAPRYSNGRP